MGALFLVLIAMVGWAMFKISDACTNAKIKREINQSVRSTKEWVSRVTDNDLEIQLEDYIYRDENRDAVIEEVRKAFEEWPNRMEDMPKLYFNMGQFPKGVKLTKKQKEITVRNSRSIAMRVLMGRHGKMSCHDAEWGIENNGFSAPTILQGREWNLFWLHQAQWLNERLKEHGIDEEMFIDFGNHEFYTIESCPWRNGRIVWAPTISPWETVIIGDGGTGIPARSYHEMKKS